jgi:hypothetical protein
LEDGPATEAQWEVENRFAEQSLRFVLRVLPQEVENASVANPCFEANGRQATFPVQLQPRQYLVCEGDAEAIVYDANGKQLQTVAAEGELPRLSPGRQTVQFNGQFAGEPPPRVEVKFKTVGELEGVQRPVT